MQSEPVVKPYRDLPNGDGGEIQEGAMLHSLSSISLWINAEQQLTLNTTVLASDAVACYV